MYDTRLVTAAQEGDEAAFAALYDRNADAVYDLCWALTGDEAEASRLVVDTFTLAARHVADLTDASQVRPWLLAIARDRALTEDEAGTLRSGWGVAGGRAVSAEPLSTAQLRPWVREAGAIVALADQVVVELTLRHNLDAAELAAAIGCGREQVDAVVSQVNAEAEGVLGALVVARQGRKACAALAKALSGWDGVPTVESAETADAHIQGCDVCTRRRTTSDPLGLLATAPPVPPPVDLRTQVLDRASDELAAFRPRQGAAAAEGVGVAGAGRAVAGDGGPRTVALSTLPSRGAGGPGAPRGLGGSGGLGGNGRFGAGSGRPGWLPIAGVAIAVLVLITGIVLVFHSPRHTTVKTVTPTTAPSTTAVTTPGAPLGTIVPVDSTTTTLAGSRLDVTPATLNFGAADTADTVTLINDGQIQTEWQAAVEVPWVAASPSSGTLQPNQAVRLTVTVVRSLLPAGQFSTQVNFSPSDVDGQGATLAVSGSNGSPPTSAPSSTTTAGPATTVETSGPAISNVGASPASIEASPCPEDSSEVTATVTDTVAVSSVIARYTLPNGAAGSVDLIGSGDEWSGRIFATSAKGTISFELTATDAEGLTNTSSGHSIIVTTCPL